MSHIFIFSTNGFMYEGKKIPKGTFYTSDLKLMRKYQAGMTKVHFAEEGDSETHSEKIEEHNAQNLEEIFSPSNSVEKETPVDEEKVSLEDLESIVDEEEK